MDGTMIPGLEVRVITPVRSTETSMSDRKESSFRFTLSKQDTQEYWGKDTGKIDQTHTDAYEKQKGIEPSIKDKIKDTSKENGEVKDEASVVDKISEKGEEIKAELAKTSGLTEEEVEEAMETLGLTVMDLLDPEQLSKLFLLLQGSDQSGLLTDASMYQDWQELLETVEEVLQEISEETGIPLQGIKDLITDENAKEMFAQLLPEMQTGAVGEDQNESEKVMDDSQKRFEMEAEEEAENATGILEETSEEAQEISQAGTDEEQEQNPENAFGKHRFEENVKEKHITGEQNTEQLAGTSVNMQGTEPVSMPDKVMDTFLSEQTKSIMDQMLESIKTEMKPEATELKMLLNPESLGSVNVTLVAKEGSISAQFTAQNEAVKNALEYQMTELREALEEKGIQVTEVEVTVETGAFNRQYSDEKREEQQQEAFEKEVKQLRTRHINLFEGLEEDDLEEEDALTAKIMKENGNSLDYLA